MPVASNTTTPLDQLLKDNNEEILKLQDRLKDVIPADSSTYDKVWLLRYILSNKTAEEAEQACRFTLQWHKDHEAAIDNIKKGGKAPHADIIRQFQVAGEHKFTRQGEPIFYVR